MGKWKSNVRSIMAVMRDKSAGAVERVKQITLHNMKVKSWPVEFRTEYERIYDNLRGELFGFGVRANHGALVGGTRKQARKLARAMARHEIRMQKVKA